MYRQITDCRLCHGTDLVQVLDLGTQALTGVFPRTETEEVPAGPLALVKCTGCGLVQLAHNYELSLLYGDTYGYRSGLNRSMVQHLQHKVQSIERLVPLREGDLVIDIGSNDGTLLGCYSAPGLRRVGIDPSGSKFLHHYKPGVELIPEFFSAAAIAGRVGGQRAKVITSIAMFYDLERPVEFVRQVSDVLADDGLWVFEQSYLPTMIATNSYDTVCHEHLEYYTLKQICHLTEQLGLKIVGLEFNDVNGGSFSVTAAKQGAPYPEVTAVIEEALAREVAEGYDTTEPFRRLEAVMRSHRTDLRCLLERAASAGEQVFGYGASTKGNVLLQYCGIDRALLPVIAEVNEDKFGCFTPGTRIPIIAETEARTRKPDYFLVLPWHFRKGIVEKETAYRAAGGKLVFPLPTLEIV